MPSCTLKALKLKNSCLIFTRPHKKYESPCLHSAWDRGIDLRYLFRSNCCHIPSEFRRLKSHLPSIVVFLILKSWRPKPLWFLGWKDIYIGRQVSTELISVNLPSMERCLPFQLLRRFSNRSSLRHCGKPTSYTLTMREAYDTGG